jgi:capsular polysaccharide biosynthesis protein
VDRLRSRFGLLVASVAAGAAVGLLAGFVASLFQPTLYRAETAFVVQRAGEPLAGTPTADALVRTVRDLLTTNIVTQVVIRNLQLNESSGRFDSRMHVGSDGSAVLRVEIDDAGQAKATQIAQELATVFTQIVQDRFAQGAQPVQVVVFDPAHDAGKVSPPIGRDLGWGALIGALAGLLVGNVLLGRRPRPAATVTLAGTFPEMADALLARSAEAPFQTVLLVGADGERVAAGVADSLAERGAQALWLRSNDASAKELARLAAHVSYVLVASASVDPKLVRRVDLVASF